MFKLLFLLLSINLYAANGDEKTEVLYLFDRKNHGQYSVNILSMQSALEGEIVQHEGQPVIIKRALEGEIVHHEGQPLIQSQKKRLVKDQLMLLFKQYDNENNRKLSCLITQALRLTASDAFEDDISDRVLMFGEDRDGNLHMRYVANARGGERSLFEQKMTGSSCFSERLIKSKLQDQYAFKRS
ncbi:MAG: hypothetical protein OXC30_00370 [Alphaproteobacteria bacterium]|nr:hypothetical protein [Alphaproteobacteria bacterium]